MLKHHPSVIPAFCVVATIIRQSYEIPYLYKFFQKWETLQFKCMVNDCSSSSNLSLVCFPHTFLALELSSLEIDSEMWTLLFLLLSWTTCSVPVDPPISPLLMSTLVAEGYEIAEELLEMKFSNFVHTAKPEDLASMPSNFEYNMLAFLIHVDSKSTF